MKGNIKTEKNLIKVKSPDLDNIRKKDLHIDNSQ